MEALGFAGFMLEPLGDHGGNYLGAYEEAKSKIKGENYVNGFADGIAAGLKGMSPRIPAENFGSIPTPVLETVLGTEGLGENYHNKGLVDGYKYFRVSSGEATKLARGRRQERLGSEKDDAVELAARGVRPMVLDMFEKVRQGSRSRRTTENRMHTPGLAISQ
jgi:hypothetical protein